MESGRVRAGACAAFALALVAGSALGAGPGAPVRTLRLKSGDVETSGRLDARRVAAVRRDGVLVMQLDGPMTRARRERLAAAGVTLLDYLPEHAYFVRADGAARLAGLEFVAWVGEVRPEWKIDPELGKRAYTTGEREALRHAGKALAVIALFEGADGASVARALTRVGGRALAVHSDGRRLLMLAEMRRGDAGTIAADPGVQFIEDAPEGESRFDSYRWVVQSNVNNFTPVWNRGLHGEGQVAGVIDTTVRTTHCAFTDAFFPIGPTHRKVVGQRDAQSPDSHGTHVAGILAGDYGTYGQYDQGDGIAFAARLSLGSSLSLFSTPTALYDALTAAHNDGARVHSNSFGDSSTTAYTSWCAQVDQFAWDNEDDLVVFSVSNGSVIKTPENAMNTLAVGASQDAPQQASFCFGGAGPTADGRRKPEVFAPGCNIVSANSNDLCTYFAQSGTSMASPAVAGSAVLVRQYFTDGYYPTGVATPANTIVPSGALLRAVMANSAVDMTGVLGYPSNQEGWGRILLDNTLYFPGDQRKLLVQDVRNAAGLGTGETASYTVTVLSSSAPLTITMAYTHPAAALNAAEPVANNLDLEITAPGGVQYRGNVFSGGQSVAGTNTDPRNTLEQFLRTAPAAGVYEITIRGTQVNVGTQGFGLVVSGDIDLCLPPVVPDPPQDLVVSIGTPVTFTAEAYGTGTLTYQWKKNLADIPGATASAYTIASADLPDAGEYSVTVTGTCGTVTTLGAQLTVTCVADFDHNGFVNGDDFDSFTAMFDLGDEAADVDHNGFVNGDDFDLFMNVFDAGC